MMRVKIDISRINRLKVVDLWSIFFICSFFGNFNVALFPINLK